MLGAGDGVCVSVFPFVVGRLCVSFSESLNLVTSCGMGPLCVAMVWVAVTFGLCSNFVV